MIRPPSQGGEENGTKLRRLLVHELLDILHAVDRLRPSGVLFRHFRDTEDPSFPPNLLRGGCLKLRTKLLFHLPEILAHQFCVTRIGTLGAVKRVKAFHQ